MGGDHLQKCHNRLAANVSVHLPTPVNRHCQPSHYPRYAMGWKLHAMPSLVASISTVPNVTSPNATTLSESGCNPDYVLF
ncbi:uncharacterized protein K444DRAFT_339503 [Hyaloscypha bicolor E]|uniref:Uncharacterized protein n=1 Tax=Hyaloscypha bicolor E TaxID=1095630 RepID=A0A2J6TH18_9HELO|nr:uncharacterized protein K444DRAFT_339503 [Hyaloscypha bicolor E]PMD62325.1 hypothetical protein K444DRAFT_339503 [Hyaloscypha bicolor E]